MSTPENPLQLVDRYLQAVRFWLPRTSRQQDLVAEFGEDLRSQIEERETELGRPLDTNEISEVLKRCGAPMLVASRFGPKRHLIGPALFPIYWFVLKMVLLWILLPVFIFIVSPATLASTNGDWGKAVVITLGNLWSVAFFAAAVITLVFAILERTQALANIHCKWDPSTLPPLEKPERKTSLFQTVCELGFHVFAVVWLLLVPHHPFLVFGPAAAFLAGGPIWGTFYAPIVLLAVTAVIRSVVILVRPQWKVFPLASQIVQAVLILIVMNYMIGAAGRVIHGDWHPFVMIADSVRGTEKYADLVKVVAIINVSGLIWLVCTWVGVSIGAAVHLWELLKHLRKQRGVSQLPASLEIR
jgi:hypothetical protein